LLWSGTTRTSIDGDGLRHRDQIAAALAADLLDGVVLLLLEVSDRGCCFCQLSFQREDPLDSGKVEAFLGQALDPSEAFDVSVGVTAASATGTGRGDQALALIDAQRLRVNAGQLCSNRDHIDRSIVVVDCALVLSHGALSPLPGRPGLGSGQVIWGQDIS
jgi:hypothetical protein